MHQGVDEPHPTDYYKNKIIKDNPSYNHPSFHKFWSNMQQMLQQPGAYRVLRAPIGHSAICIAVSKYF